MFLISKFAGFYSVPGLASVAVFVAFLGGIQLLLIGIMGEYVARIHDEVKGRPLYLVSDTQGLEPPGIRRAMAVTSRRSSTPLVSVARRRPGERPSTCR